MNTSKMNFCKFIHILGAFILVVGCAQANIRNLEVGVASNFSDVTPNSYNPLGNHVKNAVQMATEEINPRLYDREIRIQLKHFNYGGNKINVRKIATESSQSNLIAMIGYEYSSHALLAAPIHQENRFPMITPSASADRVATIGDYVFQGTFNNSYQAEMLAEYAVHKLNLRTVMVITAVDCAYCQDLAKAFEDAYNKSGGNVLKKISVLSDQKDFNGVFQLADFEKIDAIFIPNQELTSARIISHLLSKGVNKVFLGGDGWRTLGDIHKTKFEQEFTGYMMAHWKVTQKTASSLEFVKKYKARFGTEPTDSAALAYDSMLYIGEAIENIKQNDISRESFKNSLSSINKFFGVTGEFIFRKNKAPKKSILLMKSSPNGFVINKIISPKVGDHGG